MKALINLIRILILVFIAMFNNDLYSQEAINDCRVLLYRISGSYEGGCKNGFAHGKGIAIGIDQYEGKFKQGLPNGTGTYTWENGNVYTGDWKSGKRSGIGTLYSASNGEQVRGFWENNDFVKEIEMPEFRIVTQYNIQSVTVKKVGDMSNKVIIKFKRDGQIKSDHENTDIIVNSGVLSKSQYFIYNTVLFPWQCNISFISFTRFSNDPIKCKVKLEIDKPGEWEVIINY